MPKQHAKREAERRLKQHAVMFGKGTINFYKRRQVKAEKQNHLQKCISSGSASFLGAACARVKQHANVKWNGSPSSMGTAAYD